MTFNKKIFKKHKFRAQNEAQLNDAQTHIARQNIAINPDRVQFRNMKPIPKDIESQNALADRFYSWAWLPTSELIEQFPLSEDLNPYKFFHIADKNDYFADALQRVKYMLGNSLFKSLKNGEIDSSTYFKLLPMYNNEFRDLVNERFEKLRGESSGAIIKLEDSMLSTREIENDRPQ